MSLRNGQSGPSALRLATVESGGERRKLSKELRWAEMAVRVRRMWMFVIKNNVEVSLNIAKGTTDPGVDCFDQ